MHVRRLSGELGRATAVVASVSRSYLESGWAQAEIYHAVACGKLTIPILVPPASLESLNPPLARLLRDTQSVTLDGRLESDTGKITLADLLKCARKRRRGELGGHIGKAENCCRRSARLVGLGGTQPAPAQADDDPRFTEIDLRRMLERASRGTDRTLSRAARFSKRDTEAPEGDSRRPSS
jgi:hypothetical protein